jgi:2-polyprenyl-3-methyl-5-hydroxy-6-metoxy-1,4-benzoquinol methylase
MARSRKRYFRRQVVASITSPGRTDASQVGRYVLTLDMIRMIAQPEMKVADIGSRGQILPALRQVIGFTDVTTTNAPDAKQSQGVLRLPPTKDGVVFTCPYDLFDIEELFPYPSECFDLIILTEVLEHITRDPMHTLSEINRVTKAGGWLMLSTPNCTSLRSVINVLRGRHPQIWSQYSTRGHRRRHNREYTPQEVAKLVQSAGYCVVELRTANDSYVAEPAAASKRLVRFIANHALFILGCLAGQYVSPKLRGEAIYVLAQKSGPVSVRFPDFLYMEF